MHPWYLLRLYRVFLCNLGSIVGGFFVTNTSSLLKENGDSTLLGKIITLAIAIGLVFVFFQIGSVFGGSKDEQFDAALYLFSGLGLGSFLVYRACALSELMPKDVKSLFVDLSRLMRKVERAIPTKEGSYSFSDAALDKVHKSIKSKLIRRLPLYLERLRHVSVEEMFLTEIASDKNANKYVCDRVAVVLEELGIKPEEQVKLPFYARHSS